MWWLVNESPECGRTFVNHKNMVVSVRVNGMWWLVNESMECGCCFASHKNVMVSE